VQLDPRRRERIRTIAARLGLEPQLKRAAAALDPTTRRARRDEEHLSVLVAAVLDPDSNCVDVGAHSGDVLGEMVRCAPEGRHIAFEPLPEFAERLRREFPGVEVRNVALSSKPGRASFSYVADDPQQSGLVERGHEGAQTIDVELQTLDDALPDDYVPRLVKIDVEGAEVEVLRGAAQTLRRHRPIVVFEHGLGGADRYGHGPRDVWSVLVDDAGLRMFDIDGHGPYTRAEFDAVFTEPLWNFVARP
jgi:FkbM family methyltransferase